MKPKDRPKKTNKCGVIYDIKCGDCDNHYVGETARSLETRFKEHTDGKHLSSAVCEHMNNTGHKVHFEDVKVLAQEDKTIPRKIREALKIHQHQPTINRDQGVVRTM